MFDENQSFREEPTPTEVETPVEKADQAPFIVTDNLPSPQQLPDSFKEKVAQRDQTLNAVSTDLDTLITQLTLQQQEITTITSQIEAALVRNANNTSVINKADSFVTIFLEKANISALAAEKLAQGKDVSKMLGVNDDRFRNLRIPRNIGDIWQRIKRDSGTENNKQNFYYAQWRVINDLSTEASHQDIFAQITKIRDMSFPSLVVELNSEPNQVVSKSLPEYISHLKILKRDLVLLQTIHDKILKEEIPVFHDNNGKEINIKKGFLRKNKK